MADDAETLARKFHHFYEGLAPQFGYETRKETRVDWDALPSANKDLMVAVARQLLANRIVTLREDLRSTD